MVTRPVSGRDLSAFVRVACMCTMAQPLQPLSRLQCRMRQSAGPPQPCCCASVSKPARWLSLPPGPCVTFKLPSDPDRLPHRVRRAVPLPCVPENQLSSSLYLLATCCQAFAPPRGTVGASRHALRAHSKTHPTALNASTILHTSNPAAVAEPLLLAESAGNQHQNAEPPGPCPARTLAAPPPFWPAARHLDPDLLACLPASCVRCRLAPFLHAHLRPQAPLPPRFFLRRGTRFGAGFGAGCGASTYWRGSQHCSAAAAASSQMPPGSERLHTLPAAARSRAAACRRTKSARAVSLAVKVTWVPTHSTTSDAAQQRWVRTLTPSQSGATACACRRRRRASSCAQSPPSTW